MKNLNQLATVIFYLFTAFNTYSIHKITSELDWKKHDFAIIQEFRATYFSPQDVQSSRKLAFSYIDLVKDTNTRFNLREMFMWDTVFSIVRKPENKGRKFKYDPDNPMWGTFVWNLSKMKTEKDNYEQYIEKVIQVYAPLQIGEYASTEEIYKIFHPAAFTTIAQTR